MGRSGHGSMSQRGALERSACGRAKSASSWPLACLGQSRFGGSLPGPGFPPSSSRRGTFDQRGLVGHGGRAREDSGCARDWLVLGFDRGAGVVGSEARPLILVRRDPFSASCSMPRGYAEPRPCLHVRPSGERPSILQHESSPSSPSCCPITERLHIVGDPVRVGVGKVVVLVGSWSAGPGWAWGCIATARSLSWCGRTGG